MRWCLLVFVCAVVAARKPEPCITYEGEEAQCVFIDRCPVILKAFNNPYYRTAEWRRKFSCGTKHSYVCCNSTRTFAEYGAELSDISYCGYQHSDDYPTGINGTTIDEFPWLAAIKGVELETGEEKIVCHGTLINSKYVLTVSQCLVGLYKQKYNLTKVVLGEYQVENKTDCITLPRYGLTECTVTEEFTIAKKIKHPFFNPHTGHNDIALLRLNGSALFSDYIRPICLPIKGTVFAKPGEMLYTTGWGKDPFSNKSALVKKRIQTTLISHEECKNKYSKSDIPSVLHIFCTSDVANNTEFSCGGDAGAPVVFKCKNQWHLEGIVSRGGGCGRNYPGRHTRITSYLEWIRLSLEP